MTARVGGGALIAAGQGVGNLGQALMQAAAQRHAEELAQQQQAAEEHYREQMLGVQRDQLAQGDRHFGETLEQNYRTHGFSPGGGSAPSTGDALLDLAGGSQPAPLSLGAHLMGAATGRERPSPSTRSGWVYDPGSDPDVVRQRAHDSAASAEGAADRQNRLEVARISASSRGGGGGGEAGLRRHLLPAAGFAESFVRENPTATQSDVARWTRRRVPGLDEGTALAVAGDAIDAVHGKPGAQSGERVTATPSDRVALRRAANDMFEGEPARADSAYHSWAREAETPVSAMPAAPAVDMRTRARALQAEGKTPAQIAQIMQAEGYNVR